jgi:diguanylate cyclase (GGDEF)-like protein
MLDIDDFKLFNDTKGHQAADEVLSGVGALLRTHFRGEDIACRYGGEEFILVLPDCDLPDAVRRMEELRRAFAREKLGVTFSAGLAEWPTHGRDWTGVVKQADAAMYEAKRGGKNRTAAAPLGADDGQ